MKTPLALGLGIVMSAAALAVSAQRAAADPTKLDFLLSSEPSRAQLTVRLISDHQRNVTSGFEASELPGLDLAALNGPNSRPLRFAWVRDAGRIDCASHGGNRKAAGECRFQPSADFATFLASNGIARPAPDEARTRSRGLSPPVLISF